MRLVLLAVGLALSGCAMRGPLSHVALEQNTLVAQTTDDMMLTNILRAREREPMHFTSLSALHGNVSLTAETDLTAAVPTGASAQMHNASGLFSGDTLTDAANTFTPVIKGTLSTNPSFDLAVNDSQAFYQGFLAPLEPKTIAHFLDDGWPAQMLTYLVVGRFDFVAEGTVYVDGTQASSAADDGSNNGKIMLAKEAALHRGILVFKNQVVRSLMNDANPAGVDFDKFKNFVSCYQLRPTRMKKADVELLPLGAISNLTDIEKLDGKVFDVRKSSQGNSLTLVRKGGEEDGLKLERSDSDAGFRLSSADDVCSGTDLTTSANLNENGRQLDAQKIHFDIVAGTSPSEATGRDPSSIAFEARGIYFLSRNGRRVGIPVGVAATIRSTEALLYFLGEYTRYSTAGRFQSVLGPQEAGSKCDKDTPYDLVVLDENKPAKSVLEATVHGRTWWVPDNSVQCNGRTMEVIALVEQLYNLHKSSTDKIGTQSVRLIQ